MKKNVFLNGFIIGITFLFLWPGIGMEFYVLGNNIHVVDKFSYYAEFYRLFTSENNALYNIEIQTSKMSKDGDRIAIFGQDRDTKCKRALILYRDTAMIEEINMTYLPCETFPTIKGLDINSDGTIVYWYSSSNTIMIYEHQNKTTEILLDNTTLTDGDLRNRSMSQILCDASGEQIFIRSFEKGIFRITKSHPKDVQHIIKADDLKEGEKVPSRFDIPMTVSNDGKKIVFGVNQYYEKGVGNIGAKDLFLWNDSDYEKLSDWGTDPCISGDGKTIVYKTSIDEQTRYVCQNQLSGDDQIPLIMDNDITVDVDLSYDGSFMYSVNYLTCTNGEVGIRLCNLANISRPEISSNGKIVGIQHRYYADKWENAYYIGLIGYKGYVYEAPQINDISLGEISNKDQDRCSSKVTALVADSTGLDDIDWFTGWLIENNGDSWDIIDNWNDDGTGGDDLADDWNYRQDYSFPVYDTFTVRAQVSDQIGNITVADAIFYIDTNTYKEPTEVPTENPNAINPTGATVNEFPYVLIVNPDKQMFTISLLNSSSRIKLSIYKMNGQLLISTENTYDGSITMDCNGFMKRVYLLLVETDNQRFVRKIIF